MQVTLVHNPRAGDPQTPDADALVRLIRDAGHAVRYQSARDENWAAVLDEPADLIAAAGGDGTVGRVARRMIGRGVRMTAVSLGTANNICRSLGLTDLSIPDQISGWQTARTTPVDAGVVTGAWGQRYFVEGLGIGLFAALMAERRKDALRRPADAQASIASAVGALRAHLPKQRPKPIHATLDGTDISGRYLLFEVLNMQFVGPNLYLAPGGRPGDGYLDVVIVRADQREELDTYMAAWEAGHLTPPQLSTFRGRTLRVGAGRHALHVDDWMPPFDASQADLTQPPFAVDILPAAIQFLVP